MPSSEWTGASTAAFREGAADPWLVSEDMADEPLPLHSECSIVTLEPTRQLADPQANQWAEDYDWEGLDDHLPLYPPPPPDSSSRYSVV
jgi:hypothetical protein